MPTGLASNPGIPHRLFEQALPVLENKTKNRLRQLSTLQRTADKSSGRLIGPPLAGSSLFGFHQSLAELTGLGAASESILLPQSAKGSHRVRAARLRTRTNCSNQGIQLNQMDYGG